MKTKQRTRNRRIVRRLKDGTLCLGGRKIRKEPNLILRDEDIIDEVAFSELEDEEEQFESSWQYV